MITCVCDGAEHICTECLVFIKLMLEKEVQPCGCLPPRVYCIDHQPEGEE